MNVEYTRVVESAICTQAACGSIEADTDWEHLKGGENIIKQLSIG